LGGRHNTIKLKFENEKENEKGGKKENEKDSHE